MILAVCAVLFSVVFIAFFAGGGSDTKNSEETTTNNTETTESESIEIEPPESGSPETESGVSGAVLDREFKIPEGAEVISANESISLPEETTTRGAKAETDAVPQTASTYKASTEKETEPASKPAETKYSCGTTGHKCESPETHAYICNLELDGCPYCGSHSCPSFYGTDQWGNGGFFPELCPEYTAASDAAKYCKVCGKKQGDGSNGTCVQFVSACTCPGCSEYVEAWTCHNHG